MIHYYKKILSNQFAVNYLKIFSVDVLVKGSGIILLPIYLKLMTQDEFGMYGYLLAVISTFSLVFNLGMYAAQSKFYHEYSGKNRGEMLFSINVILFVFIACLFFLILVFDLDYPLVKFLFKTPFDYAKYRLVVLVSVVSSVYSLIILNFLLTSEDIKKVQLFNILRIVLVNGIVLFILLLDYEKDHVLVRLKYSTLVEAGIIVAFSIQYVVKMRLHFDFAIAKRALSIGLPITVSAFLGIFINLSDRYFLDKYGSLKDLSIYNLAISIAGVIPFVFASFQNIWLPQFLKEKDYVANRARSKKMILRLLVAFVGIAVMIMIALKFMLILNIIDSKYDAIMPLLPIVIVTGIVASLTSMFSNHLVYLDKLYLVIIVGVPIALLGILLNQKLVPLFNIYGTALSSLVLNLCYMISYAVLVQFFYNKKIKNEV